MYIKNIDMTLSGLKLDLSDCFNLAEGRYTICQTILDSRAYYEMWDNLKNKEVVPYADGKVRLIDKDGKVIRPTIKNIVRAKYDSEYCQDKIPDKPNEEWYFIDEWFLKGLRNCREALLISNYCRIKTYTGYNAKILHQYENAAGYFEILPQSDGKQVHIKVHRLEAFYFVRQVEGKMWITPEIFQDLAIHHLKTKKRKYLPRFVYPSISRGTRPARCRAAQEVRKPGIKRKLQKKLCESKNYDLSEREKSTLTGFLFSKSIESFC